MHLEELRTLSDHDLLTRLVRLQRDTQALTAELLAHLAEVDRRQLYLREGCSSLFAYALEVLGCSEDEAGKRVHAARTARQYPLILDLVAKGELHLTAVNLLAPHLTPDNHAELFTAASRKSKRQIEELLAERFPQEDAKTRLARLSVPSAKAALCGSTATALLTSTTTTSSSAATTAATPSCSPAPMSPPASSAPAPRSDLSARLAPLAPERYRLQVTLGATAHEQLRRAQAMLRHQNPSGDLAVVIEQAIALLCAELETRRCGKRRRGKPAAAQEPTEPTSASASSSHAPEHATACHGSDAHACGDASAAPKEQGPADEPASTSSPGTARSRHVPRAIRRAVYERDGNRCTYVSPDGRRCSEQGFLELHHLTPFARGGATSVAGLTLRCRAHNAYQAVLDFGALHMRRCIQAHQPPEQSP